MICPDCSHDNIAGVETCEECGQPLVEFDTTGSELEECITRYSAKVLCPKKPIAVDAAMPARAAIDEMVSRKIGCLLVEQEGKLVGIFTERDVLGKLSTDLEAIDQPVSEFMTRAPETITGEDSIAYALQLMDLGGYRHLPMVDAEGKPIGIISVRDILRFLCIRFSEVV